MKIRKLAFLSTLFAILLPMLVVATVVISYTYPISTNPSTQKIYLAIGPNYADAKTMNLVGIGSGWTGGTSEGTYIPSGYKIFLNTTTGSVNTYLLNVLEIINSTGVNAPTTLWINGTLPSGVIIYYNEGTPISMTTGPGPGSSAPVFNTGTASYTPGNPLLISKGVTTVYLAFVVPGSLSATSTTLYINYQVT